MAESSYSVGQAQQADVLKARTQLSRMIDELIKLGRERRVQEADLNRVLGRAASEGASLPAVEASLAAYRVSRVDLLTLLDSQMTVFNYETNRVQALANYWKALAEIEQIAGKPLPRGR